MVSDKPVSDAPETPTRAERTRSARVVREERVARAIALRRAGASYATIGEQNGTSHVQAWRDVQRALRELVALRTADTEQLRELELARLDQLATYLAPKAQHGHVSAVRTLVRISESRRRLLGLDAPNVVEVTTPGPDLSGLTDGELRDQFDRLMRARRRRPAMVLALPPPA